MNTTVTLFNIPREIISVICEYLDNKAVRAMVLTCKDAAELRQNGALFYSFYLLSQVRISYPYDFIAVSAAQGDLFQYRRAVTIRVELDKLAGQNLPILPPWVRKIVVVVNGTARDISAWAGLSIKIICGGICDFAKFGLPRIDSVKININEDIVNMLDSLCEISIESLKIIGAKTAAKSNVAATQITLRRFEGRNVTFRGQVRAYGAAWATNRDYDQSAKHSAPPAPKKRRN